MDTAALKDSWTVVAKHGDDVPLFFYSHLFLTNPDLRQLFPVSMSGQRDRLVGALGRIVSNVDQIDEVVGFIQQLGRDHRRFSVVAEHYGAVGASLLATLEHFAGGHWTEAVAADWAAAYGLIAKVMVEAAEESEATSPAYWEAEVIGRTRRTIDITVLQLRPTTPIDFQPGQSLALEAPQRPRLWRYYSPANAPRDDGTIELHVQLVAGGQVSGALIRSLSVGDVVKLGAPVGERLTLPADLGRPLLMVAGGTGLAPLRSLLEQIDRRWQTGGTAPDVHLFHGARTEWGLYEHERLTQLAARPWFTYTGVASEQPGFDGPQGLVGDITMEQGPWERRTVLVCGSEAMVEHVTGRLREGGVAEEDLRFEEFGGTEHSPTPTSSTEGPGDQQ